jgi:predicted metallopeptidase
MNLKLVGTSKGLIDDTATEVGNLLVIPEQCYSTINKVIKDNGIDFLKSYRIKYLFCTKPRFKAGKKILGSCKLFPDKDRLFHSWDAVVTFDKDFWEMYPDKREPLIFHELCHLEQDDDGILSIISHDIEEFTQVWKRYGDWQGDLARAGQEQLSLNLAS